MCSIDHEKFIIPVVLINGKGNCEKLVGAIVTNPDFVRAFFFAGFDESIKAALVKRVSDLLGLNPFIKISTVVTVVIIRKPVEDWLDIVRLNNVHNILDVVSINLGLLHIWILILSKVVKNNLGINKITDAISMHTNLSCNDQNWILMIMRTGFRAETLIAIHEFLDVKCSVNWFHDIILSDDFFRSWHVNQPRPVSSYMGRLAEYFKLEHTDFVVFVGIESLEESFAVGVAKEFKGRICDSISSGVGIAVAESVMKVGKLV